jgi:hypothetical protein
VLQATAHCDYFVFGANFDFSFCFFWAALWGCLLCCLSATAPKRAEKNKELHVTASQLKLPQFRHCVLMASLIAITLFSAPILILRFVFFWAALWHCLLYRFVGYCAETCGEKQRAACNGVPTKATKTR